MGVGLVDNRHGALLTVAVPLTFCERGKWAVYRDPSNGIEP